MKDAVSTRIRFGEFLLDLKAGELHKGSAKVRLQEQPFQVLQMLAERAGEVVSREEIQSKLWPNDTVVEFDHGINTAIRKLRTALNDSAEKPCYIETVARRGYRLIVPVEVLQSSSDGPSSDALMAVASAGTGIKPRLRSTELTPGKVLSHYRVLNIIGGGGMGIVYRAEDLKLGRAVALKFLPEEVSSDPLALARFEREAQTGSSLNHPNICTIYEVEEHEATPFIVMEFLEGMTLREMIGHANIASPLDKSREPALDVQEILDIAIQIADGLDAAHQKAIIHRDIKPANIFLTRTRQVKILDFGLAKLITEAKEGGGDRRPQAEEGAPEANAVALHDTDNNLTREGASIGTAGYMSPEQVQGLKLDARTDLFCFGLVVYELVTGKRAFGGGTKESFREAVLYQSATPVREINPAVPPKLEAVIDRCLQKERNQRYQHASELRTDLKQIRREMSTFQIMQGQVAERIAEAQKAAQQPAAAEPEQGKSPSAKPARSRRRSLTLIAVVLIAAMAAGFWYWDAHRGAAFTEKDAVVLGNFANNTGDPVFDDALNMALSVELLQSPYLHVLSPDKVRRALKQLNLPPNSLLTPALAQQVCVRTNSKAFVTGSIADAGNHYRLELKAVDCHSGKTLANSEQDAPDRGEIVKTLGLSGTELRSKLGEPRAVLQKFSKPLDEATTSSPEALQASFQAVQQKQQHGDVPEVFSNLNRAIELDPNYAQAYLMLGVSYLNRKEVELSLRNIQRAYDLRYRLTERARFQLETFYYIQVTGEADKSLRTLEQWADAYPTDAIPRADLSEDLQANGQYDAAVEQARESVRLLPTGVGYVNLVAANIALNRLDEAKAAFEEALQNNQTDGYLYEKRYTLAFVQNDDAAMQEQLAWARANPAFEHRLLGQQADTEAYHGRLARSQAVASEAVESAKHNGEFQAGLGLVLMDGLRSAEAGDAVRAGTRATEALAASTDRDIQALAALVLARAGEVSKAEALAEELSRKHPVDTWMQDGELPVIRAAIALQRNDPAKAIDLLRPAARYDLANLDFRAFPLVYPVYLRGEAYLKAGQGQMAAAEFQKIIDHPGIVTNFITGALAPLQLARAQAMMGDTASARKSYEEFLGLWKDADRNLPVLQQAKAEYNKL